MAERQCTKCRHTKPLDEFGPSKTGKHGKRPACRECMAAYHRRYKAGSSEQRDKHRARRKERYAKLGK